VRKYEILLARHVRAWLTVLEAKERQRLLRGIWIELRHNDPRTAKHLGEPGAFRRDICGYSVDYLELEDSEAKRRDLHAGHLVFDINLASNGSPH